LIFYYYYYYLHVVNNWKPHESNLDLSYSNGLCMGFGPPAGTSWLILAS
jgi:hypothetical protein